jgi:hypothetical protein
MTEIVFLVEDDPGGGFTARALGHSIFTEAETPEELEASVRDAVHCHFEPDQLPVAIRLHYVRDAVIAV